MIEKEELEIKEEENEVIETDTDSVLEDESGELVEDEVTGDTLTPSEESSESNEEETRTEKMLTQSQVNELVGRARQEGRDSAMRELLERYGVGTDSELNDVFGKGQIYDDLSSEFENQGNSYKSVMAENALLKSHIDESRWEDVKLILGGKGLDVNTENIEAMIATHPEWRAAVTGTENGLKPLTPEMAENMSKIIPDNTESREPAAVLRKLGNEPSPDKGVSEEEHVRKLFGY